ncbi:MAG: hypothetical protein ACI849_001647, partial [Patiriisocius sp.]
MLEKGFLRGRYAFKFRYKQIALAIMTGFLYSILIYSFLIGMRFLFRGLEFGYSNGPYLINNTSRYWQNFNFALVSFAIGNGGFLRVLFSRKNKKELPRYLQYNIGVDQVFFSYNFAHLFFKLMFMLFVFSSLVLDLKALNTSTLLFVLLFLVLFFEGYKTILRVYRKRSYKLLISNFLVLFLSSFVLANTSVFNYNRLDSFLLQNNPQVGLPISVYSDQGGWNMASVLKVFLLDGAVTYHLNNDYVPFNHIPENIMSNRNYGHNSYSPTVYLLIAADLPMKELVKIQKKLARYNIVKLVYVTTKEGEVQNRFNFHGIPRHNPPYWMYSDYLTIKEDSLMSPLSPPPVGFNLLRGGRKKIDLIIPLEGNVRQSMNQFSNQKELYEYFRKNINSTNVFNFVYKETISYQNYIRVYGLYRKAIENLRLEKLKELGYKNFDEYDKDYRDVMKEVKNYFPI